MEASSPLASLQPNHPARFPAHGPASTFLAASYASHGSIDAASSFNFKDLSMFNPRQDYFSIKPVRGSSPTASLAADLSQNFHIDQSPQLPTPRRNLFNGPSTGFGASRLPDTPPVPSSSPGMDITMDVSPLPHKPVSGSINTALANTLLPTPDPTPVDDVPMAPPPAYKVDVLNMPRPQSARPALGHQRRISSGTRPSLRKGVSTTVLSARPNSLDAPFIFGPTAAPPPILESFADSPPSERKPAPSFAAAAAVPVPRLTFPETTSSGGSPVGPLRRMSASRVGGPRIGLSRRTQSMQYSASRPMRQDKRCCTEGNWQPSVDLHETRSLRLPHFKPEDEVDALPRITPSTLVNVRNGLHAADVGPVTIIDCRFEYEFEGGHIGGALNFNDKESLASVLFSDEQSLQPSIPAASGQHCLVFHCEYSNHRAPIMAKFIRQRDRFINSHRYPHLTYPEIYIVDGGYSTFFKEYRDLCEPQNYVEMDAKEHEDACERGMAKVKRRAKLSRAQTYAFGQSSSVASPLPTLCTLSAVPSVPELPTFSSPVVDSPTGLLSVDAMDVDTPMPMPRIVRRNDSY